MKQYDEYDINPLTKRCNYCIALPAVADSLCLWPTGKHQRESAVQQGYSVSFQQRRREQELALHLPVNLYLQNLISDTILGYGLVQVVIHIGLGFPHTGLCRGLDLPKPILYICILYNSILFSE